MIFILLGLTSLSMTISRSIHVAVNGIISFFLITAYLKKKKPRIHGIWLSYMFICHLVFKI